MDYRFRLWLTKNERKIFGEGPLELLKKVEELGSLRQAAMSMEMSYSKAWKIINGIEQALETVILERHIGGEQGGGSRLTEDAKDLMDRYESFSIRIEKLIEQEIQDFFEE